MPFVTHKILGIYGVSCCHVNISGTILVQMVIILLDTANHKLLTDIRLHFPVLRVTTCNDVQLLNMLGWYLVKLSS